MLSNVCTKIPVNDLKSNGFLDCRSYESNKITFQIKYDGHKAVYFNYARDLLYDIYKFLFSILFLELNTLANNTTAGAIIIGKIDANLILIKKANGIVMR